MTLGEADREDELPVGEGPPGGAPAVATGHPVPPGEAARAADERALEVRATARAADLRLARLHLRTGALALARAELEAAHAAEAVADGALLDLAEARWRTGDLAGAGQAAGAYLAVEGDSALATVIAAEAAMADGRPTDAGSLQARSASLTGADIDGLFAGMARSSLWPPDPAAPGAAVEPEAARAIPRTPAGGHPGGAPFPLVPAPHRIPEWPAALPGGLGSPSIGASAGSPASDRLSEPAGVESLQGGASIADLDPAAELALAAAALRVGAVEAAVVRLGLLLRRAPAGAPAVLDGLRDVPGPLASLVRGDAWQAVGRGAEASAAWGEAATAIAEQTVTSTSVRPERLPSPQPSPQEETP